MTEDPIPKARPRVNTSRDEVLAIARKYGRWTGDVLKKEGWPEDRIQRFFGWLKDNPKFQMELMCARGARRVKLELEKPRPRKKKRKFYAVVFYGFNTCKG
jgi:hypothetical protein